MKTAFLIIVGILVVGNSTMVFPSSLVFKHAGDAIFAIKADGTMWLKAPPLTLHSDAPVASQNLVIKHTQTSRLWTGADNVYTSGAEANLPQTTPSGAFAVVTNGGTKTAIDNNTIYYSPTPNAPGLTLAKADIYLENHVIQKNITTQTQTDYCTYSDGRIDYNSTESKKFFLKDHLGSTRAVVDDEGHQTEKVIYDAYGLMITDVAVGGTESKAKQKFTGKEYDQDGLVEGVTDGLQLYYFGKRYYDAEIGEWIGCDPAHQFWTPYRYTTNPIGFIDIQGLAEIRIAILMREYQGQTPERNAKFTEWYWNKQLAGTGDHVSVQVFSSTEGLEDFLKKGDRAGIAFHHRANASYGTDNAGTKIELSDLNNMYNFSNQKLAVSGCEIDQTLSGLNTLHNLYPVSGVNEGHEDRALAAELGVPVNKDVTIKYDTKGQLTETPPPRGTDQ